MKVKIKVLGKDVNTTRHGRLKADTEYSDIELGTAAALEKMGQAVIVKAAKKKAPKKK